MSSGGRARHLGRRDSVRKNIPAIVPIPKFMLPSEVLEVNDRKELSPNREWGDLIDEVIQESLEDDVK